MEADGQKKTTLPQPQQCADAPFRVNSAASLTSLNFCTATAAAAAAAGGIIYLVWTCKNVEKCDASFIFAYMLIFPDACCAD